MKQLLTLFFFLLVTCPALPDPVPGMGLDLTPPKDFLPAKTYSGFEHVESDSFIMVTELPIKVSQFQNLFTAERLATRGMTLKETQTVDDRKLYLVEQFHPGTGTMLEKWILVLGDESRTLIINGGYPISWKETLTAPIRTALLSSNLIERRPGSELEDLPFTWQTPPEGQLKPDTRVGIGLVFSPDGAGDSQGAYLVVGPSLITIDATDAAAEAKLRLLKENDFQDTEIESVETLNLGGLPAAEILAKATDLSIGKTVSIYQLLILNTKEKSYLRALGQASTEEFEDWLPEFRKLARSLRFQPGD